MWGVHTNILVDSDGERRKGRSHDPQRTQRARKSVVFTRLSLGGITVSVIKTRTDLIAFLREKAGYTGKDDFTEVKSFVDENVELADESGNALDLKAIWDIVPKSKIKAVASLTAQIDEDEKRLSGKGIEKPEVEGKARERVLSGYAFGSTGNSAKKAYKARRDRSLSNPRTPLDQQAHFDEPDTAEAFGAWSRLCIAGEKSYPQRDNDESIVGKTMVTTTNTLGGALIPEDFSPALIDLRQKFGGIIGSIVPIEPMMGDTKSVPRQTGDVSIYAVGEGVAPTASDLAFDNVQLVAKKLGALSYMSSELFSDAAISVADRIAYSMVWGFNKALETDLFLGDGTATYHGYVGITYKPRLVLEAGGGTWTTDANKLNLAGWATAAGNTWAEITEPNFSDVESRFQPYEGDVGNPKYYCSKRFYKLVMEPIMLAKGGVTAAETRDGVRVPMFHGYEVVITNAMPRTEANSQVCCVFGDLAMGCKVGEVRNSMSIASSTDFAFSQDLITYRGLTRAAISVHDVGNYNSTAASREAGPICGLITANA